MTKSDAFEMLKRPGMNILNLIIRFSQTSLAAVAISYSYGGIVNCILVHEQFTIYNNS